MDPRKQHSWSCVRPGPGGGRQWFFCPIVGAQSRQRVQRPLQPDEAGLGAFPRPMATNCLPRGGSAARFGAARARPFDGRSRLWCPLGGLFQACRSVAGSAFDFAAPCPLAAAQRCRHVSTCLCSGPWREQPVDGDDFQRTSQRWRVGPRAHFREPLRQTTSPLCSEPAMSHCGASDRRAGGSASRPFWSWSARPGSQLRALPMQGLFP